VLALTFDDGPDTRWTAAVLDALAACRARATFFVLGERVRAHPELVARAVAEGHAVGVHGDAHLRHPDAGRAAVAADLAAALAALAAAGVAPGRWRVPWGALAPFTAELAALHGLALTGWTADTHDWRGDRADAMLAAVEPGLAPGAVVLCHDGIGSGARRRDCAETVALVGPLVAAARARGLEPVALDAAWRAPVPRGNPAWPDPQGSPESPGAPAGSPEAPGARAVRGAPAGSPEVPGATASAPAGSPEVPGARPGRGTPARPDVPSRVSADALG